MNEQTILDTDSHATGLVVTPQGKHGLSTAATWSKFLTITVFFLLGLMAIALIIAAAGMGSMGSDLMPFGGSIGLLLPFVFIGFSAFIYLKLFRFATLAKSAVATGNTHDLESALLNLGSFFKIVGIMTVIVLALYAIALIFLGSMMASFG